MDPFVLTCDALGGEPRVRAFRGDEALGRCFDYDVFFSLGEDDSLSLDPKNALGAAAELTLGKSAGAATIAGRVAELELLEEVPHAMYRLRLVPSLWFLRHSAHDRVFVGKTFPEILKAVLEMAGIAEGAYDLRLTATYAKREHVCQWRESDLAFLERWMEREGIHYFFQHGEAGSKLVICDSSAPHAPLAGDPIPYFPRPTPEMAAAEAFQVFHASLAVLTKEIGETDYNYLTPDLRIHGVEPVAKELSAETHHWAEDEQDDGGAKRVAKLRAEEAKCGRERFFAEGTAFPIHPGYLFSLEWHPVGELNRDYLAVRVVHRGQIVEDDARVFPFFGDEDARALGDRVHQVAVDALASDVVFRPARSPWPEAGGLELAIVDGPADDHYAQLDEHGRYLVKLMMDENDAAPGKASTRVRHIQPHGGKPEGWHLPLRKGTEVLLAFVGGDPDRPIIVGGIPNATTPSPVTRANSTKNVFQTGGRTRVEIEDQDGGQYIDISTPPKSTYLHLGAHAGLGDHNIAISTAGDGLIHTGGNRDITVGGVQNEDVKGTLTETYHSNQTTHVSSAFSETLDAGATQTIHAGFKQTISGGSKQTISGGETRTVSGGATETLVGGRTQLINGSSTETITGAQTQTICAGSTVVTPGPYTLKADGSITIKSGGPINMLTSTYLKNAPGGATNLDHDLTHIFDVAVKIFALVFQPTGIAVNVFGVSLGVTGMRRDEFGYKVEAVGCTVQNLGMNMKTAPRMVRFAAATIARGFEIRL